LPVSDAIVVHQPRPQVPQQPAPPLQIISARAPGADDLNSAIALASKGEMPVKMQDSRVRTLNAVVEMVLGDVARPIASRCVEAHMLRTDVRFHGEVLSEVAACTFKICEMTTAATIARVRAMVASGHFTVICGITQSIFDETSLPVRECDTPKEFVGGKVPKKYAAAHGSRCHMAKILQTELSFAVLLRDNFGRFEMLDAKWVTPLQVMDSTSGECIAACIKDAWSDTPFDGLIALCPKVIHLWTCDRAGGNLRANQHFANLARPTENRLRTDCIVHRCQSVQTYFFDAVKPMVSGIIHLGLAMKIGGGTHGAEACCRLVP
jgi:hypothetical protein